MRSTYHKPNVRPNVKGWRYRPPSWKPELIMAALILVLVALVLNYADKIDGWFLL
jgi:hypothetical protein